MHPVIEKTFAGLSTGHYFRHLFFGILLAVLSIYMVTQGGKISIPLGAMVWLAVSVLLYPYSRYVYESIFNFIIGDNQFIVNAWFSMTLKVVMMFFCYMLAVFVAPVGLVFLYFYNSRQERLNQ